MKLSIDTSKLELLKKKGSEIIITPQAEEAILTLLEMQQRVDQAVSDMKLLIETAALEYNPNFKSVSSDKLKIGYRAYGGAYGIDVEHIDDVPKQLYEKRETVTYLPKSKEIEKWLLDNEVLPVGVYMRPRAKQISIKVIGDKTDE